MPQTGGVTTVLLTCMLLALPGCGGDASVDSEVDPHGTPRLEDLPQQRSRILDGFRVDRNQVRTGYAEMLEVIRRITNHQMHVQRQVR